MCSYSEWEVVGSTPGKKEEVGFFDCFWFAKKGRFWEFFEMKCWSWFLKLGSLIKLWLEERIRFVDQRSLYVGNRLNEERIGLHRPGDLRVVVDQELGARWRHQRFWLDHIVGQISPILLPDL